MPPKRASHRKSALVVDAVDQDGDYDDNFNNGATDSQQLESQHMQAKLQKCITSTRKKQNEKRAEAEKWLKAIQADYKQKLVDMEQRRQNEILQVRKQHLAQLRGHLQRKRELEEQIVNSLHVLGHDFIAVNNDFLQAVTRRGQDLKK